MPPGVTTEDCYRQFSKLLSQADASKCLSLAQSLADGPEKRAVLTSYFARPDIQASVALSELATMNLSSSSRLAVSKSVLEKWGASEPQSALEWLSNNKAQLAPSEIGSLHEQVLLSWTNSDCTQIMDAIKLDPSLITSDLVVQNILLQCGQKKSYEDAGKWLIQTNLANEPRIRGLLTNWLNQNPIQASEWVQTLSKGQIRDIAALEIVQRIAQDDKESAQAWTESITNENIRLKATKILTKP